MPQKSYALKRGEAKRLAVNWRGNYKDMTFMYDYNLIGQIPDVRALKAGRSFSLPDGSTLKVTLAGVKLQLERNGFPLPGSTDDAALKLNAAAGAAGAVAGLGLLSLSLRGSADSILGPTSPYATAVTLVYIAIFAGLAVLIWKRQRWAVWAALILYGLDSMLLVVVALQGGHRGVAFFGLFIRAAIFFSLYQGFAGIDRVEAEEATLAIRSANPNEDPDRFPTFAPLRTARPNATPDPAAQPHVVLARPPLMSDPTIHRIVRFIDDGDPAAAREPLLTYMRQNPQHAYGWYLASFVLNAPAQRAEALRRALRYDPSFYAAQERMSSLERLQKTPI